MIGKRPRPRSRIDWSTIYSGSGATPLSFMRFRIIFAFALSLTCRSFSVFSQYFFPQVGQVGTPPVPLHIGHFIILMIFSVSSKEAQQGVETTPRNASDLGWLHCGASLLQRCADNHSSDIACLISAARLPLPVTNLNAPSSHSRTTL